MDSIINLFLNEHGVYARALQFEVIVLVVVVTCVITLFFPSNYGFVIILVTFLWIISTGYISVKTNTVTDFNKITMLKLNKIQQKINQSIRQKIARVNSSNQKLSSNLIQKIYENNRLDYLYLDANIIHFLYSLLALAEWNPEEFYSFVKGINNILQIKGQIEDFYTANKEYPHNTSEMFEVALQLKTNTVNNLHNFVYSVPKLKVMTTYITDVLSRYQVLISRNLDTIHTYYINNNQMRGIHNSTKYVTYDTSKPYDAFDNYNLHTKKSNNTHKLLQFYV